MELIGMRHKVNFNDICQKWNYDESLKLILSEVYDALIKYYGEDAKKIIYQTLYDTKVIITKTNQTIYDALISEGMKVTEDDGVVKIADLKRASGVSFNDVDIIYENGEFIINKTQNCIIASNFSGQNKTAMISALIHEVCHAIKSKIDGHVISDETLVIRSGLIESTYKLSVENGKVIKTLTDEKGVGLEEAFNSLDQEAIMRSSFEPEFEVKGYATIKALATKFSDALGIKSDVHYSQLYNKKELLRQKLSPDLYDRTEKCFDELYKMSIDMYASMFMPEKLKEIGSQMQELIQGKCLDIFSELKNHLNKNSLKLE